MSSDGRHKKDATCAFAYIRDGSSLRPSTTSDTEVISITSIDARSGAGEGNPAFARGSRIINLILRLAFPVRSIFLLVCLFILIGCAGVTPPAPTPGLELPPISVESLRASAVVIVKKGISLSGRATVLVQRPGSFRIEVSGPFGQTIVLLISDGDTFYIYSGGDKQTMRWDDPLMPYPIKAAELVSLMIGAVDSTTTDGAAQSKDSEGRWIKLKKTGLDGQPFEVTLSDYRITGGITLPFNIKLIRGIEELTIKYSTIEINPSIPSDTFQISADK